MDPSIAVFLVGSGVSFAGFYWLYRRRLASGQAPRRSVSEQRQGALTLSFLDNLRREAGLRAQAILNDAAYEVRRGARRHGGAAVDSRLMERLAETRSMLQTLLPREFTSEFDNIVRLLHAPASVRRAELDDALERLDLLAATLARGSHTPPSSDAARRGRSPAKMTSSWNAVGDAA